MRNRFLSIILICLFAFSHLSLYRVSAAEITEQGELGEDMKWTLYNDGELVITGEGPMPDWTSSKLTPWYAYLDRIKTLTVKKGVTTIGDCAFANFIKLSSINLSETVTTIGVNAFWYTGLGDLKLNEGLIKIKENAFTMCKGIKALELPSTLKKMEKSAFESCSNLKTVTIYSKDAIYGHDVFHYTANGLEIHGYKGSTAEACSRGVYGSKFIPFDAEPLREVFDQGECGDDAVWVLYSDGELVISGSGPMENWKKGQSPWHLYYSKYVVSVTITEGITSIGSWAFDVFQELESIKISNTVQRIESYAFADCIKLKQIELPESVEYIGSSAFFQCRYLTKVTIKNPNAVLDGAVFRDAEDITLYGYKGSTAEAYPDVKFELLTEAVTAPITDRVTDPRNDSTTEPEHGNEAGTNEPANKNSNMIIVSVIVFVVILISATVIALIRRR